MLGTVHLDTSGHFWTSRSIIATRIAWLLKVILGWCGLDRLFNFPFPSDRSLSISDYSWTISIPSRFSIIHLISVYYPIICSFILSIWSLLLCPYLLISVPLSLSLISVSLSCIPWPPLLCSYPLILSFLCLLSFWSSELPLDNPDI